jgi:hypothetical protein
VLKQNAFLWDQEQQEAFEQLKEVMSQPPLLAMPNFAIPLDACGTRLGDVLMQNAKPIAYFSKCSGPRKDCFYL